MSGKVFCCSQFFNELDLLELKLETLDPVVDYFVISESTKTHSGLNKSLYYEENKDRFKKFHHKIIHQIVDFTPSNYDELVKMHSTAVFIDGDTTINICEKIFNADWFDKNVNSYLRDTFEKEALLYPLYKEDGGNLILLGDLDEIPRPKVVLKALNKIKSFQNGIFHFQHDMFYYYLNLQKANEPWFGTFLTTLNVFKEKGFSYIRTKKPGIKMPDNGGWHFTYQGGTNAIKTKVKSWGEQSLNRPYVIGKIEDNVRNALEYKQDLFFRHADFVVRNIDDGTFPKYLVDHQNDIFRDYIYRREDG